MNFILNKNHTLISDDSLAGVDGENNSELLNISIEDENLLDKWAYIEFKTDDGGTYTTSSLPIAENKINYTLTNGLLKKSCLQFQVIFRDDTGFIWKSFIKEVRVGNALNASEELPEEYPDFITDAQKILDDVTSGEQTRVGNETTRQTNETTRQTNETTRQTNEQTRVDNETARQTNETTRQANEQIRVANETAREAERQNYYTKNETYSKEEVNFIVRDLTGLKKLIVETLPSEDIDENTIYLVPKQTAEQNDYYDEYLYINNSWEHIGSTQVDMDGYVQKTTTIAGVDLQDNITASELRTAINVENGAQVNAMESVSAGGVALTPDANKNVDIPIAGANLGVVKLANSNYGIDKENDGQLRTAPANNTEISNKSYEYKPITTTHLDYAVKVGITTNTNTLTSEEKKAAKNWIGVKEETLTQAEYDALDTPDPDTTYFIIEE